MLRKLLLHNAQQRGLFLTQFIRPFANNNQPTPKQETLPNTEQQPKVEVTEQKQPTTTTPVNTNNTVQTNPLKYQKQQYKQHRQIKFASQFLFQPKPSLQTLFKIIKQTKNSSQQESKLQQQINKIQNQLHNPISQYQQKIDLTPDFFLNNFIYNTDTQKEINISSEMQHRNIKYFTIHQIKQSYNTNYFTKLFTKQFLNKILERVIKEPEINFFLNVFYQQYPNIISKKYKPQITQNNLLKVLASVSTQQYNEVNQLKFYWSILKMNPFILEQYSHLILKQLIKIKINGKSIEKQFKILYYFFLNKKVSNSVVEKLVNKANTLEQFIDLWILTITIISKIDKIISSGKTQNKINFNDAFQITMTLPKYRYFFMQELPLILYTMPQNNIFTIYRKALQYYQHSPKDIEKVIIGKLQQQYNLSLNKQKSTEISYPCDHDPQKIIFKFLTITNPNKFIFPQYQLITNIYGGQYHKVLNYCQDNFLKLRNYKKQIFKYRIYAKKNNYNSPASSALYVLKKVFKKSKRYINLSAHTLTYGKILDIYLLNQQYKIYNDKDRQSKDRQSEDEEEDEEEEQYQKKNKKFVKYKLNTAEEVGKRYQKQKKKGFFSNVPKQEFSSNKILTPEEKTTKEQSNLHYQEYRKAIKQSEKIQQHPKQQTLPKQQVQESTQYKFLNFTQCTSIEQIQQQLNKNITKINKQNFPNILSTYKQIPIVRNMTSLLKSSFLVTQSTTPYPAPDGLTIDFHSNLGDIEKNYGEYLKNSIFPFVLTEQFYLQLLEDQFQQTKRKQFKKIISHIILYKNNINHKIITLICDICIKQKSGITLLQIINLINSRNITVSYQSLIKISYSVLQFTNMVGDLMTFLKKYCEKINTFISAQFFMPYISKLVMLEKYEQLSAFIENFRNQVKPRSYKINPNLKPEENIAEDKIYKQKQLQRINTELYEIVKIVCKNFKRNTTIPAFILEIYQLYIKNLSTPITQHEYGIGLIVLSQDQPKYIDLLSQIKKNPKQNTINVLQSALSSLLTFGRNLKPLVERILTSTLLQKNFQLSQNHLKIFGNIFLSLDIPGAYRLYLEYILRNQPQCTPEIKMLYYRVLNHTSDDFMKGQINGLLDFIFNPKRNKQRIQYKQIKQQQQKKAEMLHILQTQNQQNKQLQTTNPQIKSQQPKKRKHMQKQKSIFTTDENLNLLFHANLSRKIMRNQRVRLFIKQFLYRYIPENKQPSASMKNLLERPKSRNKKKK